MPRVGEGSYLLGSDGARVSRRRRIRAIGTGALLASGLALVLCLGSAGPAPRRPAVISAAVAQRRVPHVAMIVLDDVGWNDLGYLSGDLGSATPEMTSLASRGVVMENYYGQQICTPSRVALLSGLFPFRLGLDADPPSFVRGEIVAFSNYSVPLGAALLPEYLKRHGMRTYAVGKWNIGHCNDRYLPTSRGFDSFLGYFNGNVGYYSKQPDSWRYELEDGTTLPLVDLVRIDAPGGRPVGLADPRHTEEIFLDEALDKLGRHRRDARPAFLYLALHAAHDAPDFAEPRRVLETCSSERVDYVELSRSVSSPFGDRRRDYGRALVAADAIVACVRAELDAMPRDSLLVVLSDNGGNACAVDLAGSSLPLRGVKGSCYDGGLRVPAFLYSSTLLQPGRYAGLAHHVDWIPTLLSVVSDEPSLDYPLDGVDHWPAIAAGDADNGRDRTLYFHVGTEALVYRRGDLKVLRRMPNQTWYPLTARPGDGDLCSADLLGALEIGPIVDLQVFDLATDPLETTNLAADLDIMPQTTTTFRLDDLPAVFEPTLPFRIEGDTDTNLPLNPIANAAMRDAGGFVVPWGCALTYWTPPSL